MSPSIQTSFVCPALIGRDEYVDALTSLLEGVARGEGKTLLISGEAGIGKSRLLRATRDMAGARGFNVVLGQCFEHDSSLAYGPLLDALRSCAAKSAPVGVRDALNTSRGELQRLLPEAPDDHADATLDAEAEKRRLFQALTRFFLNCAETAPLLLVIEDVHWCDAVSLEYLTQFARQACDRPVLLALSYRADEVHAPLRHMLAELDRARLATEWSLAPLDQAQVGAMLRAIFAQSDVTRADVLDALFTLSEGNPFFVEEMLKALVVAGDLVYVGGKWTRHASDDLRIPRSVQDAVQRRTGELSVPARETLRIAAVAGQRFDFELLRELTGLDEAELLAQVKELIAAQLVIEISAEQLAFRHALTRRAVYGELMARERRALHRRVATTLERLYAESPEGRITELAYQAFEAEMWPQALEYAARAGAQSLALYAPAAALVHFASAFAAAEHLARPAEVALLLGRGKAYETLGEFARAEADYQQALEVARGAEDRGSEWRALNALGFLWVARDYARAGEYLEAALETANALGDQSLRAQSLNRRANWLVNTGRAAEGVESHRQALALFEQLDDTIGVAQTLDLLGMASGIYGDAIGAVQFMNKAIPLLSQVGDTVNLASSYSTRPAFGNPHLLQPSYSALPTLEECETDLAEARRLSRQIGSRSAEAYVEFTASTTSFAFGRFAEGVAHGQESLRLAQEAEHSQWATAARNALSYGYITFLLHEEGIAEAELGLTLAREIGSAWWFGNVAAYLAEAQMLAGALDTVEATLRDALPLERAPQNLPERRLRLAWGELGLAQGDAVGALEIADELLTTAPGNGHGQPIPWLLLLRGKCLMALNRDAEALPALESALRGAQLRREPHAEWRVRSALASAYLKDGRRAEAEREAASVRACVDSLAASMDVGDLRRRFAEAALEYLPERLRSASVGGSEDEKAARAQAGGLTARERQVAALVARGLSNHGIADELVLSERTVESHVTNILGKLGFTSRAQIAAWAMQHVEATRPVK